MSPPPIAKFAQPWTPHLALPQPLAELNLEILRSHMATDPSLLERWRALSMAARLQLAGCPFLLVDAGFAQPERWVRLPECAFQEARPLRTLLASRSVLPTPLVRRVLIFAWHMARANRAGARIALGMSRSCVGIVAECRLADLEAVAERGPGWIRPRWDQRPDVWRAWLRAAARESPQGLEAIQLWGLQMMGAQVRRLAE